MAAGFRTFLVYCVGPPPGPPYLLRCWMPEWDWYDICAHLRCTKCGSVGYVDCRPNWSDVIDFSKPSSR